MREGEGLDLKLPERKAISDVKRSIGKTTNDMETAMCGVRWC